LYKCVFVLACNDMQYCCQFVCDEGIVESFGCLMLLQICKSVHWHSLSKSGQAEKEFEEFKFYFLAYSEYLNSGIIYLLFYLFRHGQARASSHQHIHAFTVGHQNLFLLPRSIVLLSFEKNIFKSA